MVAISEAGNVLVFDVATLTHGRHQVSQKVRSLTCCVPCHTV